MAASQESLAAIEDRTARRLAHWLSIVIVAAALAGCTGTSATPRTPILATSAPSIESNAPTHDSVSLPSLARGTTSTPAHGSNSRVSSSTASSTHRVQALALVRAQRAVNPLRGHSSSATVMRVGALTGSPGLGWAYKTISASSTSLTLTWDEGAALGCGAASAIELVEKSQSVTIAVLATAAVSPSCPAMLQQSHKTIALKQPLADRSLLEPRAARLPVPTG